MSILITGGTKGIGLAIAKAFAHDAGDVFLNYHSDEAAAQDAAAQIAAGGGRARLVKADVGTPDGCAAVIAACGGRPTASIRSCIVQSMHMRRRRWTQTRHGSRGR